MAVDCGAIRAAVGLADNHVSRGYGPGLGCDGQLTGVGDKTEEERAGDGTGGSWRIPAILAWRTLAPGCEPFSSPVLLTKGSIVTRDGER